VNVRIEVEPPKKMNMRESEIDGDRACREVKGGSKTDFL
jgi:hypothetical protein